MRALARAFGKKNAKLPDLPTWEEMQRARQPFKPPSWWETYAKANPGKVKL